MVMARRAGTTLTTTDATALGPANSLEQLPLNSVNAAWMVADGQKSTEWLQTVARVLLIPERVASEASLPTGLNCAVALRSPAVQPLTATSLSKSARNERQPDEMSVCQQKEEWYHKHEPSVGRGGWELALSCNYGKESRSSESYCMPFTDGHALWSLQGKDELESSVGQRMTSYLFTLILSPSWLRRPPGSCVVRC